MLANSTQWFGDGTFKFCPEIFFQIYTIHALSNHGVWPCVFGLFPSKPEAVYIQFLTRICSAVRNNNDNDPEGFLLDFELAAICAVDNVLPETHIRQFLPSSNLWKQIPKAEIQERYIADPQFALQLRMVASLAFVPPQDVIKRPLIKSVCSLGISMAETLMMCSTISRIPTLVVFVEMNYAAVHCFPLNCGTRLIEQTKSFLESITALKVGIIAFR